ncbi:hypothetical protein PsYK624_141240 [Phanerochaete sordida]|uniref:Uncharacterized protein n=1 Tax=Phanerochaete sordida TaxID=48140 RepID=A0A9P3LL41_9APHY|nr:hypothetical protein PsYK624_141240 [Phanerochaete sordida]
MDRRRSCPSQVQPSTWSCSTTTRPGQQPPQVCGRCAVRVVAAARISVDGCLCGSSTATLGGAGRGVFNEFMRIARLFLPSASALLRLLGAID